LTGNGSFTGALVVQAGGKVSPGASPGTITAGSGTWAGGGSYDWDINNASGATGTTDLLVFTNALTVTATTADRFTVRVKTLTASNQPGLLPGFDPLSSYTWTIAQAGSVAGFAANAFTLDTSGFANPAAGGTFALQLSGGLLQVKFTPAPVVASVSAPTSASITGTGATLGGNVTADGGAAITARGVLLAPTSVNATPRLLGTGVTAITATGTTGVFTVSATGLTANTAYSYAAFATNSVGTSYSATGTFTTPAGVSAPVITNGTLAVSGRYGSPLATYTITGTNSPTSYTATGLPAGLTINTTNGTITGTPATTIGSPFTVTLGATNAGGTGTATLVLTIDKAPLTVTANAKIKTTGSVLPPLTATLTGFVNGDTLGTSGVTGAALVTTVATTASPAGTYALTPVIGTLAAANYAFTTFTPGSLTVVDLQATHAVVGAGYTPGDTVTITSTFTYAGAHTELGWTMLLPTGWSYAVGGGNEGNVKPLVGTTSLLEWKWTGTPASPVTFTTTLNVPVAETAARSIVSQAIFTTAAGSATIMVSPDPLVVPRVTTHSADTDRDFAISLFELTRVIELYNTRSGTVRTGRYVVATTTTEDGFAPDLTNSAAALARHHNADTNADGRLSLVELTRVIELFNTRSGTTRTGAYRALVGSEDGFAPGP
jgi:hypothetical protein